MLNVYCQTETDTVCSPLPTTSQQSIDVQRELELCRAEIERLSCEIARGSSERPPSRQANGNSKTGTMPRIATQHNDTEVDDVYDSTTVERQMNKNHRDRGTAANKSSRTRFQDGVIYTILKTCTTANWFTPCKPVSL